VARRVESRAKERGDYMEKSGACDRSSGERQRVCRKSGAHDRSSRERLTSVWGRVELGRVTDK
jgi:hypothetical protein